VIDNCDSVHAQNLFSQSEDINVTGCPAVTRTMDLCKTDPFITPISMNSKSNTDVICFMILLSDRSIFHTVFIFGSIYIGISGLDFWFTVKRLF
jgi:hypothetical protein